MGVAGLALAAAGVMAQEAEPACDLTGEIVRMDQANSSISIQESEGDTVSMRVDASAVPGWARDFNEGDVVAVTCKNTEESGPVVVSIRMVRPKPKKR
jgi:hypothetical protein